MAAQTINVTELRDNLAAYLTAAEGGQELIITSHGHAVAKISPVEKPRRALGLLKDKIGPQPVGAWDFPNDLTDIMEGNFGHCRSS